MFQISSTKFNLYAHNTKWKISKYYYLYSTATSTANGTFSSELLLQWFTFWSAASSNITLRRISVTLNAKVSPNTPLAQKIDGSGWTMKLHTQRIKHKTWLSFSSSRLIAKPAYQQCNVQLFTQKCVKYFVERSRKIIPRYDDVLKMERTVATMK
jgi:hypothetical protein